MANIMRVTKNISTGPYPVKGSAEQMEVGDLLYLEARFQASTAQHTIRPASAGSVGSSAADGRAQFATNFAGVAMQRHDLNSYDKNALVANECEIDMLIANSVGVATAATSDVVVGTQVGVAVDSNFRPIDDMCVINGLHSVTMASNGTEAIGKLAREVKNGDKLARVRIKSAQIFD